MQITPLQQMWLHSRGGRTLEDVVLSNGELCVMMRKEGEDVPIGIPSDWYINRNYYVYEVRRNCSSVLVLRYKQKTA